jgi:hypothetical protein
VIGVLLDAARANAERARDIAEGGRRPPADAKEYAEAAAILVRAAADVAVNGLERESVS